MSKKTNQLFTEAIVGVFMIAVILMLAYFTIVISGVDVIRGDSKVEVSIVFDQVGGLKDHDSVMYRGTKVGVIEYVEVTASNLVVHANVDRNVVLRDGYGVTVRNLSMLGGNYLHLEEGRGEILPLETTVFRGETPTDWMQDMKSVAQNMRKFTEMSELKGIVTNVEETVRKLRLIANRVESGEGTIGRLLSKDDSVYTELKTTVTEAKAAFAETREAFANMKSITGKLDGSSAVEDLKAGIAAFRKAAEGFDPKGLDMSDLKSKAGALLENLNDLAMRLKNGEGTLGKLANDPELYNQVEALTKDVRQVLDNYRDTTPIATFSSLATGAL